MLLGYRTTAPVVFGGIPAVPLENDRCLVGAALEEVPVNKVEASIGMTTCEPAVVGCCGLIKNR